MYELTESEIRERVTHLVQAYGVGRVAQQLRVSAGTLTALASGRYVAQSSLTYVARALQR